MERYIPPVTEEEKLLQRRVGDMAKTVMHTGAARFSGFLSDRQQQLALAEVNRQGISGYLLQGGYQDAERKMLCLYEDPPDVFPIQIIKIQPGANASALTHRDYLGSVLGLGIKRESIGDILVGDDGAVMFAQMQMAAVIVQELQKVGNLPVQASIQPVYQPPEAVRQPQRASASVASLRLDVVLAAALHCSRKDAAALIERGLVEVNHLPAQALHFELMQGDVLSVRGKGKLCLDKIGGRSRKNRIFVEFLQY